MTITIPVHFHMNSWTRFYSHSAPILTWNMNIAAAESEKKLSVVNQQNVWQVAQKRSGSSTLTFVKRKTAV